MVSYMAIVDASKCVDCRSCVINCKDEYSLNDHLPYSAATPFRGQKWVHVENVERGTFPKVKFQSYPVFCQQCDNPPCVSAATGGALYKRDDGIVIIDPVLAKGQKQVVDACPYGVIFWNDDAQIPQKCTFCVHRLEQGQVPRCMQTCPSFAISIGTTDQIQQRVFDPQIEPLLTSTTYHPEYNTQPRVQFIGLPKTFITGCTIDSQGECLQGAVVTVKDSASGMPLTTTLSDAFGDFWVDGLDKNKTYDVSISAAGKTKTQTVNLTTDTDLGDIQF